MLPTQTWPESDLGVPPRLAKSVHFPKLGTWVVPQSMHKPPDSNKRHDAHQNNAVVVHRCYRSRQSVWEAEHDVEQNDEDACKAIDRKASFAHPESPWRDVASSCEHVGYEAHDVGCGTKDDERARKITESGLAAKCDCAEGVSQEACKEGGRNGTAEGFVDASEEVGEGSSIIASKSPECASNLCCL